MKLGSTYLLFNTTPYLQMKNSLYNLLIVLVVFSSCQKDDEPHRPVPAGVYDEAMDYTSLNPVLQITFVHDSILNIEYGKDSLDIDKDESFDIIISQRNLLGNTPTNINPNDTYPFCSLHVKNGVEVAIHNETYYIGHGQTSSVDWVDTIAYQTNLTNLLAWSESNRTVFMWLSPPTIFWGTDGPWYGLIDEEKYVAFRIKTKARYRYGWIRVMVTSRERMAVVGLAVEK